MSGFLARLARRTLRTTPDVMSAVTPYAAPPPEEGAFDAPPVAARGTELAPLRMPRKQGTPRFESTVATQADAAETPSSRATVQRRIDDERVRRVATASPDAVATPPAAQPAPPPLMARAPAVAAAPVSVDAQEASASPAAARLLVPTAAPARRVAQTAVLDGLGRTRAASQSAAARAAMPATPPMRARSRPPAESASMPGVAMARQDRSRPGERGDLEEPTTVHVTIGRIEIAAVQAPMPSAPAARPARPGDRPLSLDDYLAQRSRR